jgi:hypothetical protein
MHNLGITRRNRVGSFGPHRATARWSSFIFRACCRCGTTCGTLGSPCRRITVRAKPLARVLASCTRRAKRPLKRRGGRAMPSSLPREQAGKRAEDLSRALLCNDIVALPAVKGRKFAPSSAAITWADGKGEDTDWTPKYRSSPELRWSPCSASDWRGAYDADLFAMFFAAAAAIAGVEAVRRSL